MKFPFPDILPTLHRFLGRYAQPTKKRASHQDSAFVRGGPRDSLLAQIKDIVPRPKKLKSPETVFSVGAPPAYALSIREKTPACTWSQLHAWCTDPNVSELEREDRGRLLAKVYELGRGRFGPLLRVTSDLESLASSEDPVVISGDLNLDGLNHLTSLPPGLTYTKSLSLQGCTQLKSLPPDLHVPRNLYVTGCTRLTEIAPGLVVGRSLYLERCDSLVLFPDGVKVGADLSFAGCISLKELPAYFDINGDLNLSSCPSLNELPLRLLVRGNLDLMHCSGLNSLTGFVVVMKNAYFDECENLAEVQGTLHVGQKLQMRGCLRLHSVRADLRVGDSLDFMGCHALAYLPSTLAVPGDFILTDCESLPHLPEKLRVGGNLRMLRCSLVNQLPDELDVGGNLDAGICAELRHMGLKTHIGGDLSLRSCQHLMDLAPDLDLGGHLYLDDCVRLARLPEILLSLGATTHGETRNIFLRRTALPANIIADLRRGFYPGLRLHLDSLSDEARGSFTTLALAFRFWEQLCNTLQWRSTAAPLQVHLDAATWELDGTQSESMRVFLSRLRGTADFQNERTRPHLALRIASLLQVLESDADLRAVCCNLLGEALITCGDRIVLALNEVEILVRVENASRGNLDGASLKNLGMALWRRDLVHQEARAKCQSLVGVDEVEVFLAYEIGLRERLELPVQTLSMLYTRIAQVTDDDLAAAEANVRARVENRLAQKDFLEGWAPWQKHLRAEALQHWHFDRVSFAQLPAHVTVKALVCPITQSNFAELEEPLFFLRGNVCVVYEAAALIAWWKEHGTEPSTRQRAELDEFWRGPDSNLERD